MQCWQDIVDEVAGEGVGRAKRCARDYYRLVATYYPGRYPVTDSPCGYLTGREAQVVRLMQLGLSNRETAEVLSLSPRTTESYIKTIKEKLAVRTKEELLMLVQGKLP